MEIKEILEAVDRDIAEYDASSLHKNLDSLVSSLLRIEESKKENLVDIHIAMKDLHGFLQQSGNLIKVIDSRDLLNTAKALLIISRSPWCKNTISENVYCIMSPEFCTAG